MPSIEGNLPRATLRRSDPASLADVDRVFYDEATQTMSRDELRALQDERVQQLARRVFDRPIPFFARKLAEAGFESADDIEGVDDLDAIPVTVKQELRDSEAEHPPVGDYRGTDLRDNIRIGTSTGTTGTPTVQLWTRHDLLVDCEAGARMMWRQGVRPGMVMTHAHPAYLYSGGSILQGVYEHLGCLAIWAPPPDTDELAQQALEFWQRITPDRPFLGFATGRFMEVATKVGIDPMTAGFDFSKVPPMGKPGEPMPLMTAGSECMPYLGSACGELNGAHLCEDLAIVQALDEETGREVTDGEWGRLVVTTLGRDNFLVRYDLEEACRIERSECPCGETHARGWWGGRFKDLIRTQGTAVMVPQLEAALGKVRAVRKPSLEYQVLRPAPEARQRPLQVRVEVGTGAADVDRDELRRELERTVADALGVQVEVELLDRDTLPRVGYKSTRVVDPHGA